MLRHLPGSCSRRRAAGDPDTGALEHLGPIGVDRGVGGADRTEAEAAVDRTTEVVSAPTETAPWQVGHGAPTTTGATWYELTDPAQPPGLADHRTSAMPSSGSRKALAAAKPPGRQRLQHLPSRGDRPGGPGPLRRRPSPSPVEPFASSALTFSRPAPHSSGVVGHDGGRPVSAAGQHGTGPTAHEHCNSVAQVIAGGPAGAASGPVAGNPCNRQARGSGSVSEQPRHLPSRSDAARAGVGAPAKLTA